MNSNMPRPVTYRATFVLLFCIAIALAATASLLLLLSPAAAQAQSTVLYVDDDATGAATGLSWTDAYTTVQDALSAAGSGNEIWVAAGVYYPDEGAGQTDSDATSTFTLQNGVPLYGGFAGTETARDERDWQTNVTVLSGDIDGDDDAGANGVVTNTNNISGTNAYHVVTSLDTDSSAVLDGFTVTAGDANGQFPDDGGGGLINRRGSATLANLTFIGNRADEVGGGIANDEGALTLNEVVFTANEADAGGGMFNGGNVGSVPAAQTPSAINESGAPTLTNVTFFDNWAFNGGGMLNHVISPTLTNVTFLSNTAGLGGGLYNVESNAVLNGVTFEGNQAFEEGGGLLNDYSSPLLQNVTFFNNRADWAGGGMSNYNEIFEGSLSDSSSEDQNARYRRRWATDVDQASTFDGNSSLQPLAPVTAPELTHVTFISNSAILGGGMYNLLSTPVLSDVTFTHNLAISDREGPGLGGGMYNEGIGALLLPSPEIAPKSGAAANNSPSLTNVTFFTNTAEVGGGMFNAHISPTIRSSSFISNFAFLGGGLYNVEGSPTLSDVDFVGNFAFLGGGLVNDAPSEEVVRTLLEHAGSLDSSEPLGEGLFEASVYRFSDRQAALSGEVSVEPDSSRALIDQFLAVESKLDKSIASTHATASPVLTNVTFLRNLSAIGGGLVNANGRAHLTDVGFEQNDALYLGGGAVHIDDSVGPIAGSSESLSAAADGNAFSLTDVAFVSNTAQIGGGFAVLGSGGNLAEVQDSAFNGESAVTLLNVAFLGNQALSGGAVINLGASPALANVAFTGNQAGHGGAMLNADGAPVLTNVSIVANQAITEGAAILNEGSAPLIQNSILWANEDGSGATSGVVNHTSTPTFTHSLVQSSGGSGAWDGNVGTDGGNNIDADPLLVRLPDAGDGDWSTPLDNDYGDLRLQTGSPAIDVGDNGADLDGTGVGTATISNVSNDLAGHPRIVNSVVDMGAFEFQTAELILTKSASDLEVLPGQPLTFTLTFSNTGYGLAHEVMITDVVPALLSDLSYQATVPVTPTAGSSYSWQVADLAPGAQGSITISGVVSEALSADTVFSNTATISTLRPELNYDDNSDGVGVSVIVPRVRFSSNSYSVNESAGTATISVTLDAANPYADVQMAYETADDTATAGSDYVSSSGVLTITAGSTGATFDVPVLDDAEPEPDEVLSLLLSEPEGATLVTPYTATLTIVDDDPYMLIMPLVAYDEPGLPDLVISDLQVTGDNVQVVVSNVGEGPATDPFWVDAYVNPDQPPVTVNDVWWIVGDEGMVWGVTGNVLPLLVGESLTLTVGDEYYVAVESGFSGTIAAGAHLYAQADSAHTGDPFGGVVETHEAAGGSYNNVLGPVTAPGSLHLIVPDAAGQQPSGLPPR